MHVQIVIARQNKEISLSTYTILNFNHKIRTTIECFVDLYSTYTYF